MYRLTSCDFLERLAIHLSTSSVLTPVFSFLSAVKMDQPDREVPGGEVVPVVIIGENHTHTRTHTHTHTASTEAPVS